MKKIFKSTLAVAAIALAMVSCKKETYEGKKSVNYGPREEVSFRLAGSGSKSAFVDEKEDSIKNFQIFVFNPDGTLDACGYKANLSKAKDTLTIKCTLGEKTVCALVNHKEDITSQVMNLSTLLNWKSDLKDNFISDSSKGLVMFGSKETDLEAKKTVGIVVERLVAKVSIENIVNNLNPSLGKITLNGIYVINAVNDAKLGAEVEYCPEFSTWYNQRAYAASEVDTLLYDAAVKGDTIVTAGSIAVNRVFFPYANPTKKDTSDVANPVARYSRLVVDVTVENDIDTVGTKIAHRYYPINLVVESDSDTTYLSRNVRFNVKNLKITRLGSLSPDQPIRTSDIEFAIEVKPWETIFDDDIEF